MRLIEEIKEIKVSGGSPVNQVAKCITAVYRENNFNGSVKIRAMGASSVNQAVKSVAVARSQLIVKGFDLYMVPHFEEIEMDDKEKRTVIVFTVEIHKL